jgi:hypothetical protein
MLVPKVKWAETSTIIIISVLINNFKNKDVTISDESLSLKGTSEGETYKLELNFLHEINPEKCSGNITNNCVEFIIYKKVPSFWEKLTKNKTQSEIDLDWNEWKDSYTFSDSSYVSDNFDNSDNSDNSDYSDNSDIINNSDKNETETTEDEEEIVDLEKESDSNLECESENNFEVQTLDIDDNIDLEELNKSDIED